MLYRIIDQMKTGDQFESKLYTDPREAIRDCKAEFEALSDHDKKRRSAFYVAGFTDPDAIDHDILYSAI